MILADLWSFSLAVYAAPGVADACLTAQDDAGADVNLLLWAAWLAAQGHDLTAAELTEAIAATVPWRRDVVQPLRAIRRRLKSGPSPAPSPAAESLRAQVKSAELEAERLQQAVLQTLPVNRRGDGDRTILLQANLSLFLLGDATVPVTIALHSAVRDIVN